MLNIRRQIWSE